MFFTMGLFSWALVAHTCNPSCSGGKDLEDLGSKPTWANSLRDNIKKTIIVTYEFPLYNEYILTKNKSPSLKGLVEWLKV
jgi:hypothetical protein